MAEEGFWASNDLRRAFVRGAKWWEWTKEGATMWQSDQGLAGDEAERLYPNGRPKENTNNPLPRVFVKGDKWYAECEYCGPLPVYGPVTPETNNREHVVDTADEHVGRLDHPVKIWQLVETRIPGTAIRRIP